MIKIFRKILMTATKLRYKFLKEKLEKSINLYNKQGKFCVSLLQKWKRGYFSQLYQRLLNDKKTFYKFISLLFTKRDFLIELKERI